MLMKNNRIDADKDRRIRVRSNHPVTIACTATLSPDKKIIHVLSYHGDSQVSIGTVKHYRLCAHTNPF